MSAHFLISAIKEAWRETIAQRLRIEELLQIVQHLERENAALREDKERLDWLEECHGWPEYIDAEWHFGGEVFSSHRAAIDAARAKEANL